jgi:hypothetical protein
MLTRSNFEMSSWGTREDWGESGMVVGQPVDRFALGYWPRAYRESLRLAVVGCRGGVEGAERQWIAGCIAGCAGKLCMCSVSKRESSWNLDGCLGSVGREGREAER